MRNKQQVVAKETGGLSAEVKLFEDDIELWRTETIGYASADKQVKAAARKATKRKYHTKAKVNSKRVIKTHLKLSKPKYKAWNKHWGEADEDEASADFDEVYEKQGSK